MIDRGRLVVVAAGMFAAAAGTLGGADVAGQPVVQFGGSAQRNLVNLVDTNVPTTWCVHKGKEKNLKWVARLGTVSYGGPIVAGGKVFVGTNNMKPRDPTHKDDRGVLMCFREADGQFLWQLTHDKLPDPQQNDWPQQGVASSPAVEGDRLYYVSNRCELICAGTEVASGHKHPPIHWRLDMIKELGVFPRYLANCSPLLAGDFVYVVTANGVNDDNQVPAPQAPSFVAVDKRTGKVVWQSNAPGDQIMEGQWTNAAYAEVNGTGQVIFPGGDGWLRGFDARTGKLLWKFDCNPKSAVHKPGGRGTRNDFLSTPVVYQNRVYIGTGQNPDHGDGIGHLWCIDITKTGDLSPVNDNFDPTAEVNKHSGLVWHYGGKADDKYEAETSRSTYFGRTLSTCAVHDGLVYAADLAGFVYCLDANTGQRLWYHDTKSDIWGSPYWVDGKVYLGNADGDVYIFTHGREKKDPIVVEVQQPIKTPVVVVKGVLYLMTDSHLYAIADKP